MIDRKELFHKLALNVVRYSGIGRVVGRFTAGSGAILMLHRVTDDPPQPFGFNRHLAIRPGFLDAVLGELKAMGFRFVSMQEAVDRLLSQSSWERFVAVTADDGYRDNITVALPVLERYEAPISIYVAPGLVDGAVDLWWDVVEEVVTRASLIELPTSRGTLPIAAGTPGEKHRAYERIHDYLATELPEQEQRDVVRALAAAHGVDPRGPSRRTLMTWAQVQAASRHPLVTIGAHSIHHYNLARLSADDALAEMRGSADIMEDRLGMRPAHLAFPYGQASAVHAREVDLARQAGFSSALTTRHGVLRPEHRDHLHALPRISINGRYQQVGHVRTMVSGITTALANRGRALVTV